MTDSEMEQLLRVTRVIAVVGLSPDPSRPSYGVARYMQSQGYQIVPVTPMATEVLGERAYPDLLSIPFDVDLVDLFRRSEAVGPHVDEAIRKGGVKGVWMQLGVSNPAAAAAAEQQGMQVVMNRCLAVEHRRLLG